jgi:hypothetical protein
MKIVASEEVTPDTPESEDVQVISERAEGVPYLLGNYSLFEDSVYLLYG